MIVCSSSTLFSGDECLSTVDSIKTGVSDEIIGKR
jgi:hypothetical protein